MKDAIIIIFALFFTGLVIWGEECAAADYELHLNIRSWHHVEGEYNEENWGVGFAMPIYEEYKFEGGGYKNSYDHTSFYIALTREWRSEYVGVGIGGFLVTGYHKHLDSSRIVPMPVPFITIGPDRINARFLTLGAVSAVQLRLSF